MIFDEIQGEILAWDVFIDQRFGPAARMVSVSRVDANRRVYRIDGRIFKIRKIAPEYFRRANDLSGEYRILQKLRGLKGICQNPEYCREDGWELLGYDSAPGESLENLLVAGKLPPTTAILARLLMIIVSLNLRGVCHRDIKAENIIVDENCRLHLIDFDQAMEIPAWSALFIDIFGIGDPRKLGFFCFGDFLGNYWGKASLWIRPVLVGLRLLRRSSRSWQRYHPVVSEGCRMSEPELRLLRQAWEIARDSEANSPGGRVAYYSLDVAGCHFDGERPWTLRWSEIFRKVDFKDKRVLELGCNLGLFSAFARRAGASVCLGVDVDSKILEGSRLVSKALQVQNEFLQVDFDSAYSWEDKLAGFDLAIALSVVHWLKDRDRFFAFLGRHREVIFEGHDPIEIEADRLRKAGFCNIDVITISERNRAILHAYK